MQGSDQYTFIFLGFGIIFVTYCIAASSIARAYNKALQKIIPLEKKLGDLGGAAGQATQTAKTGDIGAILGDHNLLKIAWREFRETMVLDPKDGKVHQTRSFKNFIDPDSIVDTEMNQDFYGRFPGWIVQFGLALTFFFIAYGLSSIDLNNSEGALSLVNSLSGKFTSSIAATIAAVLVSIQEAIQVRKLKDTIVRISDMVDSKFEYMTADQILASELHQILHMVAESNSSRVQLYQSLGIISDNVLETSIAIRQMNGDLSDVLRATMSDAIEKAQGGLQQQLVSALGGLTKDFSESLTGHAESYFKNVREQMELIAGSLQNALISANGFGSVLDEHITKFQATIRATQEIIALTGNTITRFDGLAKEIDLSSTSFQNAAGDLSNLSSHLDNTAKLLENGVGVFNQCLDGAASRAKEWHEEVNNRFVALSNSLSLNLDKQKLLTESQRSALQNLSDSINLFGEALPPVINGLHRSLDDLRKASTQDLDEALKNFASSQNQILKKLNDNLGGDIVKLTDAIEETLRKVKAA